MLRLLSIIAFTAAMAFAQSQGTPSTFKVATFAIKDYQNAWQSQLPRALGSANALSNSFSSNLASKYSSIPYTRLARENTTVTEANFLSSSTEGYHFVYYYGHGNNNRITMYNDQTRVYNNEKKFGSGSTRWVMLNSCLVFQNGSSDQDPWFDGVHSILGYSSEMWWYDHSYSCGFMWLSTCHDYSDDSDSEFATRWIKNGETIWDAHKNAIKAQIYEGGGYGVQPKIVYRYGYINGVFFDPWTEKFASSYLGPVFRTNYSGVGSRWITYGTPTY